MKSGVSFCTATKGVFLLQVEYLPSDETFSADNLRVTVTLSDGSTKKWSPQPANSTTEYDGNLLGTVRVCMLHWQVMTQLVKRYYRSLRHYRWRTGSFRTKLSHTEAI